MDTTVCPGTRSWCGARRERAGSEGLGTKKGRQEQYYQSEEREDARELAAFLDLALEMAFFVEKVLEAEVGLIHVVSGIGGDLLMSARGGVGIAIEGFQAGEEGACADMNGRGVVVRGGGGGGELAEGVDDLVRRRGCHD
jgi:hypothetical protein